MGGSLYSTPLALTEALQANFYHLTTVQMGNFTVNDTSFNLWLYREQCTVPVLRYLFVETLLCL